MLSRAAAHTSSSPSRSLLGSGTHLAEKRVRELQFVRLELVALEVTNSKGALIREGFRRRAVENTTLLNGFEGLRLQKLLKLFAFFCGRCSRASSPYGIGGWLYAELKCI